MPAAPVTKTLIGSFSMFTKLHIYLISFQKNAMVNETTRNFWNSSICSIFLPIERTQKQFPLTINTKLNYASRILRRASFAKKQRIGGHNPSTPYQNQSAGKAESWWYPDSQYKNPNLPFFPQINEIDNEKRKLFYSAMPSRQIHQHATKREANTTINWKKCKTESNVMVVKIPAAPVTRTLRGFFAIVENGSVRGVRDRRRRSINSIHEECRNGYIYNNRIEENRGEWRGR